MTFSGNLNVKQTGHAMLHLDEHDEQYLIPFPNVQVKGFLYGHLYSELYGTYHIVSSTSFLSEISYSGKGFFSGARNSVEAKMYKRDDEKKIPIYTVKGCWSDEFSIYRGNINVVIDKLVPDDHPPSTFEESALVDQQDAWESQGAWKSVIGALKAGDLTLAIEEKTKVEEAQRAIRKSDPGYISKWELLFFTASYKEQPDFEALASAVPGWKINADKTMGVWKLDREKAERASKPYHGGRNPTQH